MPLSSSPDPCPATPGLPVSPQPPHLPRPLLPRRSGWLLRLTPSAAAARSQLEYLLADPEMAALLAEVPQAGRILRPLCHMLGIPPVPALRLARGTRRAPAPSVSASGRPAVPGRRTVPGGW